MEKQLSSSMGKALNQPSQGLIKCSGTGSMIMPLLLRANRSRKERKDIISAFVTDILLCRMYHPMSGLEQGDQRNFVTTRSRCSFMMIFKRHLPRLVPYKKLTILEVLLMPSPPSAPPQVRIRHTAALLFFRQAPAFSRRTEL